MKDAPVGSLFLFDTADTAAAAAASYVRSLVLVNLELITLHHMTSFTPFILFP